VRDVVLLFEVHQPLRLSKHFRRELRELAARGERVTPETLERLYFDEELNRRVLERVSRRCYLPANSVLLQQLEYFRNYGKKFKISFSLSGIFLEQARRWMPEVVESFRALASTGLVEFLDQTYYHSLACFVSEEELEEQVREHRALVRDLLGVEPTAVENTEFIYNNRIACLFDRMGFKVVVTEGAEHVLGWRSPNYLYKARGCGIRVLMRNYRLSDDIGFRFASREWSEYPLTADKYSAWLAATPGDVIVVAVDYETFGEHFPAETGILEFLRWLPGEVLKWEHLRFSTPSEVAETKPVRDEVDVPEERTISWADIEKDASAWLGNDMQQDSFRRLCELWHAVRVLPHRGWARVWRLLSTSDHFYYMSTKGGGPGEVHAYFSHYPSATAAYANYLDVLADFETRVFDELAGCEKARLRYAWSRSVPAGQEFVLYWGAGSPVGAVARSALELQNLAAGLPAGVVHYHLHRGDFASWFEFVVGDHEFARRLRELHTESEEESKEAFLRLLEERRREIFGEAC